MMRFAPSPLKSTLLFGLVAASAFAHSASAETLNLNYEATSTGTTIINSTVNVPSTPTSTWEYGNGSPRLTSSLATIPGTAFEFYDDYVFTIGGSQVSSITSTITLGNTSGISDLQVRLFSWSGSSESNVVPTVSLFNPGTPVLNAWTTPLSSTITIATIENSTLAPGTYVLQVRGNVSGTINGSYSGSMQIAPVPLPAALPLLISGLGLVGGLFGRRRATA